MYKYEAFVFIYNGKMLVAGQKRKHVHKTLREKAQALKDIENDHRTKRLQVNKM